MYVNRAPAVHKSRFANGHAASSRGAVAGFSGVSGPNGRFIDPSCDFDFDEPNRPHAERFNPSVNRLSHRTLRTYARVRLELGVFGNEIWTLSQRYRVLSGKIRIDEKSTFHYRRKNYSLTTVENSSLLPNIIYFAWLTRLSKFVPYQWWRFYLYKNFCLLLATNLV